MPFVDKYQKIDSDRWVFHKPLPPKRKVKEPRPENLAKWESEIGILRGNPYKEVIASKLPPLVSKATKKPICQKSPVFSRYTKRQHKVQDQIDTLMDVFANPKLEPKEIAKSLPFKLYSKLLNTLASSFQSSSNTGLKTAAKGSDKSGEVFGVERGERSVAKSRKQTLHAEDLLNGNQNPYMFMAKKVNKESTGINAGKKKGKAHHSEEVEHPWGTPEENHMKKVVQEYCDWVYDLGGDEDNIDELTLTCLFSGGYDTRPNYSMPVNVIKKQDLPPELGEENHNLDTSSSRLSSSEKSKTKVDGQKKDNDKGKYQQHRFGAFYLDPKTWKRMGKHEPLEDPQLMLERSESESDKMRNELNEQLSRLFISGAFMDYLRLRNARIPQFLTEVQRIQERNKELERLQEEAFQNQTSKGSTTQN